MSNPFVWFDHRSDSPSGASQFYEELFGWKRADKGPPGMTAFGEGERPWSGMVAAESLPAGWLPYAQVEDLEMSTAQAKKLGAKVLKDRTRGPAGDFVVVRDPSGGAIALWQAPSAGRNA
ncbi:MAG: VOC family protein [Myxococcota bacterium]